VTGLAAAHCVVALLTSGKKRVFLAVTGLLALAQFGLMIFAPPAFFPLLILMGVVHTVRTGSSRNAQVVG
jgi:hypothetical protein